MRILISGAAGFVGSRLSRILASRGHRVAGTFINSAPDLAGVDLEEVDLLDRGALRRVVEQHDPEVVIHLAGKIPNPYYPSHASRQTVAFMVERHLPAEVIFERVLDRIAFEHPFGGFVWTVT